MTKRKKCNTIRPPTECSHPKRLHMCGPKASGGCCEGEWPSSMCPDWLGFTWGFHVYFLSWPIETQRSWVEEASDLAVDSSRVMFKGQLGCKTWVFEYQEVKEEHYFDVANLSNYNLILSTSWLFQHWAIVGLNPAWVMIGLSNAVPIEGNGMTKIASWATELLEET